MSGKHGTSVATLGPGLMVWATVMIAALVLRSIDESKKQFGL
jgi:hypothetical protein